MSNVASTWSDPAIFVVNRNRGLTLFVSLLVLIAPFASGLRGLDASLGRVALIGVDGALAFIFILALLRGRNSFFTWATLALVGYSLTLALLAINFPNLDTALQGTRKTYLIFIAVVVGYSLPMNQRGLIHKAIIAALVVVAVYGIKQRFSFDAFDVKLLEAQSSDIYTNMIGGQIRSISLLSSGFHLGTAACALAVYSVFYPGWSRLWRMVLFALAVAACYSSLTRTFLLILFALPVVRMLTGEKTKAIIGVYVLVAASLGLEVFTEGALSRSVLTLFEDDRFQGRSMSYTGFVDYFVQYPGALISGFGPGSAGSGLSNQFSSSLAAWIEPHNILTKYIFELGIPLGLFAIWLFARSGYQAYKQGGAHASLLLGLFFVLFASGMVITSVEVWPINWYIGLIVGMYCRQDRASLHLKTAYSEVERTGPLHQVNF